MKKKKIFRRVIALFFAVLTLFSVAIQCSAAMFAPSALFGLASIAATILVSLGIINQNQADTMPQSDLYKMAADALEVQTTAGVVAALTAKGVYNQVATDLQDFVDEHFNNRKNINMSGGNGKKDPDAIGGTLLSFGFIEWVKNNVDSVKKVPGDNSVDMKGFGASMRIDNSSKGTSIPWDMYYSDYIIITKNSSGAVVAATFYGDNCIHSWNDIYSGDKEASFSNGLRFDNAEMLQSLSTYSTKFYGDIRYSDGTKADESTAVEEVPGNIGEVTDADGNTYPVNADGTVTVNGEDIPVNADGTVTINGDTYYPTYIISNYDDTALIDLIHQLIDTINQGQLIEETPADDVSDVPLPAVDADFESLQLSPSIATVFPFCIPWDLVRGIKLLAADPVAPRFEIPFNVPAIGDIFPGYEGSVIVDFAEYDKYFKVVRWGTFMIAMFGICFLTFKIVKGNT